MKVEIDMADTCDLCTMHHNIAAAIPDCHMYKCPNCECAVDFEQALFTAAPLPLSDHNGNVEEQVFRKRFIFQCQGDINNKACGQYMSIELRPISYNGNHDVYYTGGDRYCPIRELDDEIEKTFTEEVRKCIAQWVDRTSKGERLGPSYLTLWIQREVSNHVARLAHVWRNKEWG